MSFMLKEAYILKNFNLLRDEDVAWIEKIVS